MESFESLNALTAGGTNITWMRLLRLGKMLKMLRMVRVMRFFKDLRVMLHSLIGSVRTFFWSMLMLTLLMHVFGLCFMQAGVAYLTETPPDEVVEEAATSIEMHWSTIGKSMLTLYKAITGGEDWGPLAAPLRHLGLVYYGLFLFYTAFLQFAVLNVLTGIFVDAAMSFAQIDRDEVMKEQTCQPEYIDSQRRLFTNIMGDDHDRISWADLQRNLDTAEVKSFLKTLDISEEDVEQFFQVLITCGTSSVTVNDFIGGCMRIKGCARSIDMIALKSDDVKFKLQLGCFGVFVDERFKELQNALNEIENRSHRM